MTDAVGGNGARPAGELSTAELVQRVGEQISRLARDEIALARAELAQRGKLAGAGAGLIGAGGMLAAYGTGVLLLAAVAGLAVALPLWLSALLVGAALLLGAGLLGLAARRQFRRAAPARPPAVAASVRADLAAVRTAVQERPRP